MTIATTKISRGVLACVLVLISPKSGSASERVLEDTPAFEDGEPAGGWVQLTPPFRDHSYALDIESESPDHKQSSQHKLSLALTVTGGVSLGAYQAGFLYYLTEFAKRNPELVELRLATGASAGMINALLTVIALGSELEENPENSPFYRVWTEMRYNELLDVEDAPPKALSSRIVLERLADEIEQQWQGGLNERLDMVIGASTTRLKSRQIEINQGIKIPRQEEKFVFRIQGRGKGREPLVSNYVDPAFPLAQPLLPFRNPDGLKGRSRRTNFSIIRQILFASSAIPIVFLPQEIDYCLTTDAGAVRKGDRFVVTECLEPTHRDLFIDGALADRGPLRLAYQIANSSLVEESSGRTAWREMPDLNSNIIPEDFVFMYADPRTPSYPTLSPNEDDEQLVEAANRLIRSTGQLFKGLFTSAREREFYTLIENHPEVRDQIEMLTHDFPTMSGQMANFFGFFDRKLRKFDFYVGMRDARKYVKYRLMPRVRAYFGDQGINGRLPDPEPEGRPDWEETGSWRPYYCLRAMMDGEHDYRPACSGEALRDFRILLQATFDRLYDHCSQLSYDDSVNNWHCKMAMAGSAPPKVWPGLDPEADDWRRNADDESNFEHTMRLLDLYSFHFEDLGLDRDDASMAMSRIREELLRYIDAFAKKLRLGERMAVRLLGKPAINFFAYAPPEAIFYAVVGKGGELALSATLGQFNWMRFNFALQMQGFNLFLTEKPNAFALTPLVGLELEPIPLSGPLLQTRLGVRAGYQFSTEDKFLTAPCDAESFSSDSIRCSAPVAQAFLAFTFYERVRIQFGIEWFPRWLPPMSRFDKHLWNGLIGVGWQWISPF